MAFDPPLGSTSPAVLLDNATRLDELVNGPAGTVNDRAGQPLDSWRQILAMVAAAISDAQNSITAIGLPFTTLAEAQAAADDGKIPVGAVTWVRSTDGSSLADEYMNTGGTLQATGRKMLSYDSLKNLLPLNDNTIFLTSDPDGGDFPFAENYDRLGLDANRDVIFYWKGRNFTTLLNWSFPFIATREFNLNGMAVSERNILDVEDKENIEVLSQVRLFKAMDSENYPFAESFDYIAKDSMENMMWAFRGDVYFNYMKCVYREIDVAKLSVNGVSLDVNAILPTEDAQNLTRLSNASQFQDSSAFPFNPTAWTVFDKNRDVIFRVEDYLKALENIKALQDELAKLSPQANPLLPFADVTSGYSQIFAYNSETGDQVQVTNGESNETAPRPDGADRIVWQSDRADPPPGALFYAQLPDFTPHAYIARKKIVGWGHSFINNGAFLNRLHALTGLPTYNFGLSGQTSDAIAARQGGAPTYYAPVGGVIPESGAVTLTPAVPGPCRSLAAPVNLSCRLAGVDGTFAWDGTNATFTRQSPGDAVAVAVLVPLYVYPITTVNVSGSIPAGTLYEEHDECMNLIWPGRNNLNQTDLIMENVDSIVKNLKNIGQKFLLLAEFNSSAEPTGSTGFNQMTELNHRYQDKYPDFYCGIGNVDIRQNFINHANPASSGDMEDVAAGLTPRSLRYDPLHPSQQINGNGGSLTPELALDYGANVNATFTRDVLNNKGWL
ncbi:TolB family protein [Raoultella planticola]|uniref:TolB family protein n=1 Tax=Raoultella planticola TaxID=575 RepID=UPI0034E542D3